MLGPSEGVNKILSIWISYIIIHISKGVHKIIQPRKHASQRSINLGVILGSHVRKISPLIMEERRWI
jgi:hypothetical protein